MKNILRRERDKSLRRSENTFEDYMIARLD